jgi:hypothetical protein
VHALEKQKQGQLIHSPMTYADALHSSLQPARQENESGSATYLGNSQDVSALVAAVVAITALFSCCGGAYCLPIIALALGGAAYFNADRAIDPLRTRRLAGVSLGTGALMLFLAFSCMALYVVLLVAAMANTP